MKWIPLSETTPTFSGTYTLFCSENSILGFYNFHKDIPTNATHFIEIETPPLPKSEKRKDPDWKEFDTTFKEWINERHQMFGFYKVLFAMHEFLKAKYDK